jgi:hypothetical protein
VYKSKILSQYEAMRKEIADSKDNYLEAMFKYIRRYFKLPKDQWDKENFLIGLEDTIYKSLEETYSITASAAKEIYNITFTDKIDDDTLEHLTYSADGKTLMDRLNEHYDNAIERDDPTMYFYNRIVVIMDSETLYASNHVIHGKLKRRATHAEVVNPNEVCWEHEECEYWLERGKIPITELEEIPPYHPACECEVIYYFEE